jgi:periplasmic protein TonB
MGFQALLFCPDEKTARAVTQVLSELEFNVESCNEPFAAVKKLMGTHFDAIVVDCDNEQNATLLFKSARNSTPNQASLAVAVVEGQAGVAKAFRIGANLVLTKPINIEQAKGTLRVARGLLRKGDPTKPSVPVPTVAAPAAPAAAPIKTPASASVAPPASAARPVAPAVARPAVSPVQQTAASSTAIAPPAARKPVAPVVPAAKLPAAPVPAMPTSAVGAKPVLKPAAPAPSASLGSGAASAPAPAREILEIPPVEASPAKPAGEDDNILESPGAEKPRESTGPKDVPPPSFTFGGANAPAESGGLKKILLGIAAAAIVAAALFAGWTYYQGHRTAPLSDLASSKPVVPPASKASGAQPAAPSAAKPSPVPEAATQLTGTATSPKASERADNEPASGEEDVPAPAPKSAKPPASASSAPPKDGSAKDGSAATPEAAPLVVKGGAAPVAKVVPAAADAPAPSVIGIATPGSSGPLPNLVGPTDAPKPVLQRLNISQGVSQGLLIKKVDPVYPSTALRMHIEGTVQLLATISKDGDITNVQVLKGDRQLAGAASDAVKRWKYKPYLLNGEPVEIQTQVTINFKLPH